MREERKEAFFTAHIEDLANRALYGGYPVFTDFLTEREHFLLNKRHWSGIVTEFWGGHEDCDHVMTGFFPEHYDEKENYYSYFPISMIKIQVNGRVEKKPEHRDYLGAILGLGIERAKIGDIRVYEQTAYVFCHSQFADYIVEQLSLVGRAFVTCQFSEASTTLPAREFEQWYRSVASARLDSIVAAVTGLSRTKSAELVRQRMVVADHCERDSVSYPCQNGTVLSVRGYGKFRIEIPENSLTKKGKQKIIIYKYK